MSCDIFHGRSYKLVGQFSGKTAYGEAPDTPDAIELPFSQIELSRNPLRPDDDTIRGGVLAQRRFEQDQQPAGTINGKFWLNELGFWLKALLGNPVTTGAGPYEHVFTFDLSSPPDALLELSRSDSTNTRYHRFLGAVLSSITFRPLEDDPKWDGNLIMAREVAPQPSAAFDADPTVYARAQLCRCTGKVFDVDGASTLGEISNGTFTFDKDVDPQSIADGSAGYGCILIGVPSVTGTLTALFKDATLFDHAKANLAKRLQLTMDDGTDSDQLGLAIDIPEVEFDEPSLSVQTARGQVVEVPWRATQHASDPVTITLTSDVATY